MKRDIIVIGASAGGIDAVKTILAGLAPDFPASIFVTIHTTPTGPGYLANVLAATSPLQVIPAKDNAAIQHGRVYVAAPNLHLILKRGYIKNRFLPKENAARPAIDPMFRSAARTYARRVIGIVLTGNLDDGTAGLGVIKDEGGLAIVQDPNEAARADMPRSAAENAQPDYVIPLAEIAPLLTELVKTEVPEGTLPGEPEAPQPGQVVTCPGCGGVLHRYENGRSAWYQCRVGHRFAPETMMAEQNAAVEEHFWRLMSIMKEKEDAAKTLAADAYASATTTVDPQYFERQAKAAAEAYERLERLIEEFGPALFPEAAPQHKPEEG
ncbi:MAG: chemotaxis protein CheB [Chloroflexota bacterium]